jgi:asparagine synthase (glutamine-hydrolysing)
VRRAAARGSRLHLTGFGGDELLYGSVAHLHALARTSPRVALGYLRGFAGKYRWRRGDLLRQLADRSPYRAWLARVADGLTQAPPSLHEPLLDWGFMPRLPPWATPTAAETVREQIRVEAAAAEPLGHGRGQHRELETMRFVSRIARQFAQLAGGLGVTMASPYYDDRVVEAGLAVRPQDRVTPWRYKPLIVEAMRGIVPEVSRARQTKANGDSNEEAGLRRHRVRLLMLFEDSRLARLGLIDPAKLRETLTRPLPPSLQFGALDQTVACEVWLRSLEHAPSPAGVSAADTDYGMALLDEDSGQYWNLNPTAALALRTLLDSGTTAQAVQELTEQYAVDAETASQDVEDLLGALRSAGLVKEAATS